MKKISVYIVDDHTLFREGLAFLLKNCESISEVKEAQNGEDFLKNAENINPDVVLMDIEMPGISGIEATKVILERMPNLKVIALSMHSEENFYTEMIEAGAKGFLLKNSHFDVVKKAITEVYDNRNFFSPEILSSIVGNISRKPNRVKNTELSKRETEVLLNICEGLSNQEIAERLFISKRTVDKHRENILLKTQSGNTAEMVVYAIKKGYFEI